MTNNLPEPATAPTGVTATVRPGTPWKPFMPDRTDGLFALVAYALGFLFLRWVFFEWQGWGVALYTAIYCGAVTFYLRQKGLRMPRAGWFWLAVLLLTGLSYSLWQGNGLEPWRNLFLLLTAIYWVLSATGMTLLGKTSDWLPLDGLHGMFTIPFGNFGSQYRSLAVLRKQRLTSRKQIWSVLLGLLLGLMVISAVMPLLFSADNGGFADIVQGVWEQISWIRVGNIDLFLQAFLAIPTAAYLFGLIAGSAHRRGSPNYQQDSAQKSMDALRILPMATIVTVLGLVSGLYLVFIFSQLPYFFSAFVGERPEGWQVYSEYARNGFFELVGIAMINLSVLAVANLGGQNTRRESAALRVLNVLLASLTLLLIATAFSKMALYINVYGLSVKRLLPCLFMVFLAVIYSGVIVLQKKQFSIMRLAAGVGSVMLCALFLLDPDSLVANYNANRHLSGTLADFDAAILYRSGPAGVNAALKVYEQTQDDTLRAELEQYLYEQKYMSAGSTGQTKDTLQRARVRKRLEQYELKPTGGQGDSAPLLPDSKHP